ncbi:10841_t:CDS:2, partial [Gigaspora rosea]
NNTGIIRVGEELLLQKWYHTLSDPEKRLDIYVDGKDIFTGLCKSEVYTFYYIISKENQDLGLSFDDESFNDESSDDESFEDESFDDESFDEKSFDNDSTILKLRPFKNDNSDDYSSLADNLPIKDVILINKGTGKYRN